MQEVIVIAGTAALIGFTHTLLGPDHYLPFIVLSKSRKWSYGKTALITFISGLEHVLSSAIPGFVIFLICIRARIISTNNFSQRQCDKFSRIIIINLTVFFIL